MSDGMSPGGAPAPAEPTSAPIEPAVQTPNPVSTENPPKAPELAPKKEPEPTPRNAVERAKAKVEADAKAAAAAKPVDSKPEGKGEPAKGDAKDPKQESPSRAQDGKFAQKEAGAKADGDTDRQAPEGDQRPARDADKTAQRALADAPARFSTEAKAEWERTSPAVRSEVVRLEEEAAKGIEKYRESAKHFDEIRDFHEEVSRNGNSLKGVLTDVAAMERAILSNPVQGLDMVCRRLGLNLADVAEHVTGAKSGEGVRQAHETMRALHEENQKLVAIVKSMHAEQQKREHDSASSEIEAFKADRPRFDELRGTMAGLINQGLAQDLDEAYSMAERLKPGKASAASSLPAGGSDPAPASVPPAQTRRGTASIAGAPSPGSNPAARKPASSIKEALQRATARAS